MFNTTYNGNRCLYECDLSVHYIFRTGNIYQYISILHAPLECNFAIEQHHIKCVILKSKGLGCLRAGVGGWGGGCSGSGGGC